MRTLTMTKRVIKQILGDKRSLALLLVAPVFVIYLLNVILNSPLEKPNLQCINLPISLERALETEALVTIPISEEEGLKSVKNGSSDGFIVFMDDKITVTVEGSETAVTSSVKKAFSTAFSKYSKELLSSNPITMEMGGKTIDTQFKFINGSEDMTTFDNIAPLMMGFFIFFFVFLMAGVAFLGERISGTLDRLMATPIKRIEIVLGYFFGFGVFVLIQTLVIQLFMVYGLGIVIKGNFALVFLVNLLLAAGSLSLGTLLSAFAKNEFQLFQFIPVVIVPQILFCGLFSLREAPTWVQALSKIFPLTYGADALRGVVLKGYTFSDISLDILVLAFYAILFIILNSLALKRYRKL